METGENQTLKEYTSKMAPNDSVIPIGHWHSSTIIKDFSCSRCELTQIPPQLDKLQEMKDLEALSPKWNIFKSLPSGLSICVEEEAERL